MVPDLATLGESFTRHLRAEHKSPATITAYMYAVTGLADFLAEHGMPTAIVDVHREHVESYLVELLEHRSPATAETRYRGLRQFFKLAVEEGEIQTSPMANTTTPKIPERRIDVLSDDELRALLGTCDSSFEGGRDEAILRTFMDSGLRLAEVTNLRLRTEDDGSDVDLNGGVLRVVRKGRRAGLAPIGARTIKALDRYLRVRPRHPTPTSRGSGSARRAG